MLDISRRRFLLATGVLGGLLGAEALRRTWPDSRRLVKQTRHALGTEISLVALHVYDSTASQAIDAAFDEIETIEAAMSIYRPQSQLSRLNRERLLQSPHPYFVRVLRHANEVSRRTDGAFDVTVQPLWSLYATARKEGRLPAEDEIGRARSLVDWRRVEVSDDELRLAGADTAITLNGIAQGFAADCAMAALRRHGIEHALVDAGELSSRGESSRGGPWQAGIQHPREPDAYAALARLDGRCLATSGDYAAKFSADGRYNHIFDPRSGRSPEELASVSIVAPTAMQADALSTACFVLGPDKSAELIESLAGVDAFFILKSGRTLATAGFPFAREGDAV